MTGQNNSASDLPTYCPPIPAAQKARLAGATTPPMGPFEPIVCGKGFYCPPGGKENITCPAGHFCSIGAYQPTKCSFGASCLPGSFRDRSLMPLAVLLLLDVILVSLTIAGKILAGRQKQGRKRNKGAGGLIEALPSLGRTTRNKRYHTLRDGDIHLESRISVVRRANTGFLAAMDDEIAFEHEELENDEKSDPDIQQFVQSLSRCTVAANFGLSFEFENLSFQPKKTSKPILSGVTGEIKNGSFWGVMGASGAGKSTFVNVLMGRQSHTGGVTKVNGVPGVISKYKKIIGYVPQDDIVLPELTVRENILHSARIRLPSNWKEDEIQRHVDILLNCLQLSHVKNSLVGNTAAPVISGGQRKRVSIGMELAAAPMALFLDEPTSGLDATSASSIMMTLKALTRLGITVVTIIHQPRHEIFDALDSILLFGGGRMIYSGKEADVQTYFEECGFTFPEHENPADTLMDIIAGQGHLYKKSGHTDIQHLIEYWKNRQDNVKAHESITVAISSPAEISALNKTVKIRGAPWHRQLYFCFCRALLQQYRLKSSFYFELGVAALAGLLIGLAQISQNGINFRGIFLHPYELLSSSTDFSSVPEMSLLVGLSIGLTASSPGVKIFGEEKLIYMREASAGHNRFAYYIGKVLSTIPRIILANFHFTVFFIVLSTPKISWGAAFVANLLYFYCIYGLASIISMITRREEGPLIATMSSLIVGILSGVAPRLATVKNWHMLWLWRASPGTWLSEGYFTENIVPYEHLYQIDMAAKSTGFTLWRFSLDMWILFALGSAYRVLAFVGLRLFNRNSNRG